MWIQRNCDAPRASKPLHRAYSQAETQCMKEFVIADPARKTSSRAYKKSSNALINMEFGCFPWTESLHCAIPGRKGCFKICITLRIEILIAVDRNSLICLLAMN
jgi:hypothetical protein